jgi:hypothetical protein
MRWRRIRYGDLNPATMPGCGDPETWSGRRPPEPPDDDEPCETCHLGQTWVQTAVDDMEPIGPCPDCGAA